MTALALRNGEIAFGQQSGELGYFSVKRKIGTVHTDLNSDAYAAYLHMNNPDDVIASMNKRGIVKFDRSGTGVDLHADYNRVSYVAFSLDKRYFASYSGENQEIVIFDSVTHTASTLSNPAINGDGLQQTLYGMVFSGENLIRIYRRLIPYEESVSVSTLLCKGAVEKLIPSEPSSNSQSFSADLKHLVVTFKDKVSVFDAQTLDFRFSLAVANLVGIHSILVQNGKIACTMYLPALNMNLLQVFNAFDGKLLFQENIIPRGNAKLTMQDHLLVVYGGPFSGRSDNNIVIFNLQTKKLIHTVSTTSLVHKIALEAEPTPVLVAGLDNGQIAIWDAPPQ